MALGQCGNAAQRFWFSSSRSSNMSARFGVSVVDVVVNNNNRGGTVLSLLCRPCGGSPPPPSSSIRAFHTGGCVSSVRVPFTGSGRSTGGGLIARYETDPSTTTVPIDSSRLVFLLPPTTQHRHAFSTDATKSSTTGSGGGGFSLSPVNWWRNRQEKKEAEKYEKKILDMSLKDKWTIGDMQEELDEVVKSWMASMPVISNNKETEMAKKLHKTISGLITVAGSDATDERLERMTRTEKLKAAVAGETSVEEMNILIQQFQTMSLMHRVIRQRKVNGKSIPRTAEAMQALIQAEGSKFMSKSQRTRMINHQTRSMKKAIRRR